MKKIIIIVVILQVLVINARSQHEHHQPQKKDPVKTTQKKNTTKKTSKKEADSQTKTTQVNPKKDSVTMRLDQTADTLPSHDQHMKMDTIPADSTHGQHNMMDMTHAYSLNLPMNRNGSGTGWQPDATSMYGYMKMGKKWNLMVHGSIFFRYNHQDVTNKTRRSDSLNDRWDAPNWVMLMANRKIKQRGLLALSLMLSADKLIMGGDGYPLLFQSGETYKQKPLVDRQHPHDVISGLSIGYTHMINRDMDVTGYFGFPGEPAIGPPAFMHRMSSFNNPDATLGHHWQDATHITFGLVTMGLRYKILKLEFSNFTGREPDENRYDFDKPRFDSYSWRLSVNPNDNFSIQFSQAFIKSPESLEPDENVTRTTASVLHSIILGEKTHLSSAIIWGNNQKWDSKPEHSALVESNLQINRSAYYMRFESIQKSASELQINQQNGHELFPVNMLTLGSSYNVLTFLNTNLRAGLQGSIYTSSEKLRSVYGRNPLAFEAYLRLSPININALKMK